MDTSKVVELLKKVKEAVTVQGPMRNCRTADHVRKAGVAQLRAEPLLWAAYCRGWADRTTDLVRFLGGEVTGHSTNAETTAPVDPPPDPNHQGDEIGVYNTNNTRRQTRHNPTTARHQLRTATAECDVGETGSGTSTSAQDATGGSAPTDDGVDGDAEPCGIRGPPADATTCTSIR
jgi:hypothetical protein